MSDFVQLAPGLFRWTAVHPQAAPEPEPESPDDWPADVGCVAYEAPGALVLIDPLVEPGDWERLDALAAGRDGRVAVLTTIEFHGRSRSRDAAIERYGATEEPPAGVTAIALDRAQEWTFWIEEHRAIVPGDRLLGDGAGGLRMCPESWLYYLEDVTLDDVRGDLRQLLDFPVEMVLVSHGEPVLTGGRAAIERAIAANSD